MENLMSLIEVDIIPEEITISYKGTQDDLEIVKWVQDEWIEDPTIITAIANAIHMAHTDPAKLMKIHEKHIDSQLQINKKFSS
jgi:hypothetical protein